MRAALNKFLSAQRFPHFFSNLFDLYLTSLAPQRMEDKHTRDIDKVVDFIREQEYSRKIERYKLNEALISLIDEVYPASSLSDLPIED